MITTRSTWLWSFRRWWWLETWSTVVSLESWTRLEPGISPGSSNMSKDSLKQVAAIILRCPKNYFLRQVFILVYHLNNHCQVQEPNIFLCASTTTGAHIDRDPDIKLKKLFWSCWFLIFLTTFCSKALPINILGDPRHHPLWQQCGFPISLWMVGSTKGRLRPSRWKMIISEYSFED